MKISIIVNCKDNPEYFKEAIESVLNQTYPHFQLIIWDNSNSNLIENIVMSYSDKRIKYYRDNISLNLYQCRVAAIKRSEGDIVAFLDADDEWSPNKIENQVRVFKDHPKVVIVSTGTRIKYEKTLSNEVLRNYYRPISNRLELLRNYRVTFSSAAFLSKPLLKSLPDAIPPFNIIEDLDICFRIMSFGYLYPIKNYLTVYRRHPKSYSQLRFEETNIERTIWLSRLTHDNNMSKYEFQSSQDIMKDLILREEFTKNIDNYRFEEAEKKIDQINSKLLKVKLKIYLNLKRLAFFKYR